jgi:two-component system cell cycle response regulator DivK
LAAHLSDTAHISPFKLVGSRADNRTKTSGPVGVRAPSGVVALTRPAAKKAVRPLFARGLTMNILLVEDNELNRDMLVRRLTRRGYRVASATTGEEAVRMAADLRPDIVLMDIGLPVVDGWQAIRRLKASADTRDIPIIALTAHALAEDRVRALSAGCADFVSKPVDFPRLLEVISQHAPHDGGQAPA